MSVDHDVRPQLKGTSPLLTLGDTLYIGGFGEVTEIPDGDGVIRAVLDLMDGTRTIAELHRLVAADHPSVSQKDVVNAVEQFDQAGFLLDGSCEPDGLLDDYELTRWERNISFFGAYARLSDNSYELQARLRDCRVTLLGLGGLGNHVLIDLAAMGVGYVRAMDFDRVEMSNLNRQILYRDEDVGKPKIGLAIERVREFNPMIEIEPVTRRIDSTEDAVAVIEGTDIVISVVDRPNAEVRRWVNEACIHHGVPLLTGGLEAQRAMYFTVLPGQTGCVECWRGQVARDDPVSAALVEARRARGIGGDNAAFCPLVSMAAGFLTGELTRLVTGIAPPIAGGRLMEIRFSDYQLNESERWERRADCPVCGVASRSSQNVAANGPHRVEDGPSRPSGNR
jgi:molybdopterin/thiamine biosynthesis adenylyltransferase